jgi:hypothetical protein
MRRLWLFIFAATLVTGCHSIRTGMWSRCEDDQLHPDDCTHLNGVPVMLKVPSHLEVSIFETVYAAHDATNARLQVVPLARRDLRVAADIKYTERMFLVDPVRVASGTGAYGFSFTGQNKVDVPNANNEALAGHGYMHGLNYKADDKTIVNSAALLANVLSINSSSAKKSSVTKEFGLIPIEKVVAFRRFDLGAPMVDAEVDAFLQMHMNACHSCRGDGERPLNASDHVAIPMSAPGM